MWGNISIIYSFNEIAIKMIIDKKYFMSLKEPEEIQNGERSFILILFFSYI